MTEHSPADDAQDADKVAPAMASGSARWVVPALYVLCGVLFLADVFLHKHGPFAIEHVLGFYAWYGFLTCIVLVLAAAQLRQVLGRPEDYYDR